jgi:ubiquinone/menaquinone biosynthesis C-methylase UbiE
MSNPAEGYESFMVPTLFGPWASLLVESAAPQPGEHILDVASGTGVVARRAAPKARPNGRVVGLDISPNMLAVARAAAEREGFAIEWREGQAEKLPFPDGSFDLVLCQFALMFFVDRAAAVAEMHRVLKPGGRLWLSVFQGIERHPFYVTLDEAILKHLRDSGVGAIFSLGDAETLRRLLANAGFRNVEVEPLSMTSRFPNPDGFLAGEIDVDTAAIPSMQHLDDASRRALVAKIAVDMAAPLRGVTEGGDVVLAFHVHNAHGERRA